MSICLKVYLIRDQSAIRKTKSVPNVLFYAVSTKIESVIHIVYM